MGWIETSRGVSVPPTWRVAKFSRRNVEDGRPLDVGPGTRDDHLHRAADVGDFHRLDPRTFERTITMKEVERILQAVLADVREQRVALEAAVEKIYAGPALREALFVDLREMVTRTQEQHEFLSIRKEA